MKRALIFLVIAVFLLSISTAFADYIDAYANSVVSVSSTVNVTGTVKNSTGSGMASVNVTATLSSSSSFTTTSSAGAFSLLVTAPSTPGDYNISITTNISVNKSIPIHVTNFTNFTLANITFDGVQPPFSNGSSFVINVTIVGPGMVDPSLRVYQSYGTYLNWTITNLTAVNNTNGTLRYNISIPGDADGSYIIVFEKGLAFKIFSVKSTLTAVADVLDSSGASTTTVAQNQNATIRVRVFDTSGPINNSNVSVVITLPNSTTVSATLSLSNASTGTYTAAFTQTSIIGRYQITATVASTKNVSTSTFFDVGSLNAKLDIVKEFFFEFGGDSAFAAGGQIAFNVLVTNLSNNVIFSGSVTNAVDRTICTNTSTTLYPTELKNQRTGTIITFGTANITVSLGGFFGQTVCKINFTAPSETGIYSFSANTTTNVSGVLTNATATGYFQVQKYILKVSPVSTLGGGFEFLSALRPGDNATFEISARNLSSNGSAIAGNSITNITFKRITSLNFLRREADITGLASNVTAGTSSTNPKIQIVLPENRTGPYQIEVQANVSGDIVSGTAFYFAKYIEGFVFPAGFFSHGMGESAFRCGGTQRFTTTVTDVKTRQAARNVVFNNIEAARSEHTGQDVSSYLTIASATVSDSNGNANITINFSSNISYSGFYFFLINATTDDGKADIMPGGFECRTLNFFPSVSANGTAEGGFGGGFNVAPTALLNVTISNIRNLNFAGNQTMNGTARVSRLENFDPAKGGQALYTTGSTLTYNLTNGSVSFVVGAGNFTGLSAWPSGFNHIEIAVTDTATGGTNTTDSHGGFFKSVAFDMFTSFDFATYAPNDVVRKEISAKTNITRNATNSSYTDNTAGGFTGKIGRPWEGSMIDLTVTATLINDTWSFNNLSCFSCTERWNVSFTIPSSVRKGFNMIIITAKSSLDNQTATVEFGGMVNKYNVAVPDEEYIFMQNYSVTAVSAAHNQSIYDRYGINLSNISQNWGVSSKAGGVCIAENITSQRFGFNTQNINYSLTNGSAKVSVVVLDNASSGVYDTLIINNSGNITVANVNNRRFSNLTNNANLTNLYLRNVNDCGFISVLNSNASSTGFGSGFGGQHQTNANIYIPFKVSQGSNALANANITVQQIILQDSTGGSDGRGGFGFTGFLSSAQFNFTNGTTDSNGIAFLNLRNISTSGSMNLIWKLNTGTDTDVAEFFAGVQFEVKSFRTWVDVLEAPFRVINLTNSTANVNGSISGLTGNLTKAGFTIYNGTWNETANGQLVLDSSMSTFYFVLRNVSADAPGVPFMDLTYANNYTNLMFDDDTNLTLGEGPPEGTYTATSNNWTNSITLSGVFNQVKVVGNKTASATLTQLVIAQENKTYYKSLTPSGNSTRVDVNVTVEVCAVTYDRPERPVIGADITLQTEKFSATGITVVNLTQWDPFTNSDVTTIKTGPSGCAVFNVSHPSWSGNAAGWTAGQPNSLKAVVNNSGTVETGFGPAVFVQCPPGVRCYSY
ncbi:MAG: hypothetical protein HY514_03035 [Candidatus Aenigmarchaeota archaeon]|nr:hypothetical protein [Candidatus Aenigmarchaeota archaeon]